MIIGTPGDPGVHHSDQRACHWCPEPDHKKDPGRGSDGMRDRLHERQCPERAANALTEQNQTTYQSQGQQPCAGPPVGECGEQALQIDLWAKIRRRRVGANRSRVGLSHPPKVGSAHPPPQRFGSSIIPRCNAIVTACVRSFAVSLERMLEMCALTVASPIVS